jgi:hypothetical protein
MISPENLAEEEARIASLEVEAGEGSRCVLCEVEERRSDLNVDALDTIGAKLSNHPYTPETAEASPRSCGRSAAPSPTRATSPRRFAVVLVVEADDGEGVYGASAS